MKPYDPWHEKYLRAPENAQTIVHIPARLGSSRIPRKNIKELNGLPLIAYTIRLACSLPEVDAVYVNTESEELAEIARSFGAQVPILRPPELATTEIPMQEAVQFYYDWLFERSEVVGKIITMYPTSPFRNRDRIRQFVQTMDDCVFTHLVMPSSVEWEHLLGASADGELEFALSAQGAETPLPPMFKMMGSFIGHSCTGEWGKPYLQKVCLPSDPIEIIDVDEMVDWEIAETILANGLYDFGMDIYADTH